LHEAQFSLTRKQSLTHTGCMVVIPNREPFAAISHPARRRMLDLLIESDRSVNVLAGHFQMSRPAVSQHLRVLLVTDKGSAVAEAARSLGLGETLLRSGKQAL